MLLELRDVRAGYGGGEVLHGVDLAVPDGALAALLGPNGAGKSTLLKVIAGVLPPTSGGVRFADHDVTGASPDELARCGVYLVPEGRAVFPSLDVHENLRMATGRPEREWGDVLDLTLDVFPRLRERLPQVAGTLSGGEQQMLALARAFIAQPRLLLLDEPSLGLAPLVVDEIFSVVRRFRAEGVSVVLVEQYVHRALQLADLVYVLSHGAIAFCGDSGELDESDLADRYLGGALV